MSEDVLLDIVEDLLLERHRARAAGRAALSASTERVVEEIRAKNLKTSTVDLLEAFAELGAADAEARTLLAMRSVGLRASRRVVFRVKVLNRRLAILATEMERFLAEAGRLEEFRERTETRRIAV